MSKENFLNRAEEAIKEWKINNPDEKPIGGGYIPFAVVYEQMDDMPYSINFLGSSKYFHSMEKLIAYLKEHNLYTSETFNVDRDCPFCMMNVKKSKICPYCGTKIQR